MIVTADNVSDASPKRALDGSKRCSSTIKVIGRGFKATSMLDQDDSWQVPKTNKRRAGNINLIPHKRVTHRFGSLNLLRADTSRKEMRLSKSCFTVCFAEPRLAYAYNLPTFNFPVPNASAEPQAIWPTASSGATSCSLTFNPFSSFALSKPSKVQPSDGRSMYGLSRVIVLTCPRILGPRVLCLTIAPQRPQRRSALEAASKMTAHIRLQIYISVRVVTEVVVVLKGASPAAEGSSLRAEALFGKFPVRYHGTMLQSQ